MNTPAPTELIAQWRPKLRRIAFLTNNELDDVLQEAWLLAATLTPGENFVQRWLVAIERHARRMAPGVVCAEASVEQAGGDDPAAVLEGAEVVTERLVGLRLEDVVETPRTTREISQALGVCQRQARRIKRRLEAVAEVQGDLWGVAV